MKLLKNIIVLSLLFISSLLYSSNLDHAFSFWVDHNILHLLGWLFFPRIMFWFFSAMSGGFFFWLGVFLAPRIMVAYWATEYYWSTNPFLCIFAWFVAFTGESLEKSVVSDSI